MAKGSFYSGAGAVEASDAANSAAAAISAAAAAASAAEALTSEQGAATEAYASQESRLFADADVVLTNADVVLAEAAKTAAEAAQAAAEAATGVDWEITGSEEIHADRYTDTVYDDTAVTTTANAALPKSGGDITGQINLAAAVKATFGTNDDLQIYHDGSKSVIADVGTGSLLLSGTNLVLTNADATKWYLSGIGDSVSLYHGGNTVINKKLETTSTGINVNGDIDLADDGKINLGDDSNLQIYHDGTNNNSYIKDTGTGNLRINAQNFTVRNHLDTESMIIATPDSGVYLYYDNASKLATTSTGINVNGVITGDLTGNVNTFDIQSSVPSGAVFTDTTYVDATDTVAGLMSAADKSALDSIQDKGDYHNTKVKYLATEDLGDSLFRINDLLDDMATQIFYISATLSTQISAEIYALVTTTWSSSTIEYGDIDFDGFTRSSDVDYIEKYKAGELIGDGVTGNSLQGVIEYLVDIVRTDPTTYPDYHEAKITNVADTSTGIDVNGIVNADALRTSTDNTDYNHIARNSANTALLVNQGGSGKIADFFKDSMLPGQGTSVMAVNQDGIGVTGDISIKGTQDADNAKLKFEASDGSDRFTVETDLDATTTNDLLGFRSTDTDDILVLTGDGNVGIGTDSPVTSLEVSDDSATIRITGADSSTDYYTSGQDSVIAYNGTGALKVLGGVTERMSIDSTGIEVTGTVTADDFIGPLNGAVQFTAKNESGAALATGDVVYISGINGNTPEVGLADSDAGSMPAFGLAASAANASANVEIVTLGTLYGVPLPTATYSEGDILYVSATPGEFTKTPPGGESAKLQNIGIVQRAHDTNGSIKVGGAGRVNATPNLDDGNIFIGDSNNQSSTASLDTAVSGLNYSKLSNITDDTSGVAVDDGITIDGEKVPKVFVQTSQPAQADSSPGDLWWDTDGYTMYVAHAFTSSFVVWYYT